MVAVLKCNVLRQHIARTMPSQAVFARKISVSQSYLSQLLNGQRNASGAVRGRMLKATGMEFDELFEFRPAKRRVPTEKTLLRLAKARSAKKRHGQPRVEQ